MGIEGNKSKRRRRAFIKINKKIKVNFIAAVKVFRTGA